MGAPTSWAHVCIGEGEGWGEYMGEGEGQGLNVLKALEKRVPNEGAQGCVLPQPARFVSPTEILHTSQSHSFKAVKSV